MTDRIQKCMIHLNPVKSLLQHHQTRMTHSFPTVLWALPILDGGGVFRGPGISEYCSQ